MKIGLVTHSAYPDSIGGREHHVHLLAKGIVRQVNAQVIVFTGASRGMKFTRERTAGGYELVRVPGLRLTLSKNPCQIYHIAPPLSGLLCREQLDMLHLFEYGSFMTTAAALFAIAHHVPFVLTVYGYELQKPWLRRAKQVFDRSLGAFILQRAQKIICVSDAQRAEMLHIGGARVQHSTIVRVNGIETDSPDDFWSCEELETHLPKGSRGSINLLIAARLEQRKGVAVLLQAFRQVLDRIPGEDVRLFLVGPDHGERDNIETVMRNLSLQQRIYIMGAVPPAAMKSLLKAMDIVVVPSLYEGMPLIILEAMSCGKPVIASRLSGTSRVITSGVTGVLVSPGDVAELRDALLKLISDRGARNSMGEAARKEVSQHDVEREIEFLYEQVYCPALARSGAGVAGAARKKREAGFHAAEQCVQKV